MLRDTEPEVSSCREAGVWQLEVLDAEATLDDFAGLLATDCDVRGDLLATADPKATDGEAGLRECWLLVSELLEDLGGLCQRIALSSNTDVENELLDTNTPHRVFSLLGHLEVDFFSPDNFNLNY